MGLGRAAEPLLSLGDLIPISASLLINDRGGSLAVVDATERVFASLLILRTFTRKVG